MTRYDASENSPAAGHPVELYRFEQGMQRWTQTSGQTPVNLQGEDYLPASITRSGIEQGQEFERDRLEITVPRDHPVATRFIASPPEGVVAVTIYRQHASAADSIVLWKGRVSHARFSGSVAVLRCEAVSISLQRTGLRARYQLICRHALYSPGCGSIQEHFRVDGVVAAIAGATVQIATAASVADGYFVTGMLASDTGKRMIVGHAGVHLTLVTPFPDLTPGMAVRLYAGCDHSLNICRQRFNNLANYGGFPFIPGKNPFAGDAIV